MRSNVGTAVYIRSSKEILEAVINQALPCIQESENPGDKSDIIFINGDK